MGYLTAVAPLKPGVSLPQAASEMETITARLRQQYPETNNRRFNRVVSLHEHLVGDTRKLLWLLLGAVTFRVVDWLRERRKSPACQWLHRDRRRWRFALRSGPRAGE